MATSKILIPLSLVLIVGSMGSGKADSRSAATLDEACRYVDAVEAALTDADHAVLPSAAPMANWATAASQGRHFQDTLRNAGRIGQWAAVADAVRSRVGQRLSGSVLAGSPTSTDLNTPMQSVDNQRALFVASLDNTFASDSMISAISHIHLLVYEAGRLGMQDLPNDIYVARRRGLALEIVKDLRIIEDRAPIATRAIDSARETLSATTVPAGAEKAHAAATAYLAGAHKQLKLAPRTESLFDHRHEIIQIGLAYLFDHQLDLVEQRVATESALDAVRTNYGCTN